MGVDITDGILLGVIKHSSEIPEDVDLDSIYDFMENIVKLNNLKNLNDDINGIAFNNDPYSSEDGFYYIGIFWRWGDRRALEIDELWTPLFIVRKDSDERLTEDKNRHLQQQIFENLNTHFPNLKLSDIKFYDARYWS